MYFTIQKLFIPILRKIFFVDPTCSNYCWRVKFSNLLNRRVDMRIDQMVNARLVDEVRHIFIPYANYTKGI
ncbi:hypothetical protein H5410_021527 [Solanum commersonii]|uniref:Uncharacterized protein n=1 Tax=Solanum commersonii TaxID=4109 RepID=A0A9J5ZHG6_SOLCO|nr:hypothetical protein H5410_021527 [Solanum commersonii]